jgi:hypothetical protein
LGRAETNGLDSRIERIERSWRNLGTFSFFSTSLQFIDGIYVHSSPFNLSTTSPCTSSFTTARSTETSFFISFPTSLISFLYNFFVRPVAVFRSYFIISKVDSGKFGPLARSRLNVSRFKRRQIEQQCDASNSIWIIFPTRSSIDGDELD